MAKDIEAMAPVYFPRKQGEGETDDDYNTFITQNENYANANFKTLYDALTEANAKIDVLQSFLGG